MNYRDLAVVLRRRAQLLLDAAAALDSIETVEAPGRRGRKFMGPAEREEVSKRMKRYWAQNRKGAA